MSFRKAPLFACSLAFMFCLFSACPGTRLPRLSLVIERSGGEAVTIDAEIAVTEREQSRGYMGRKEIPDGTGMLFANRFDYRMRFWMKDTPHPLSIAFIDSSGVIREIRDMDPLSLRTIVSERSVRHALEVPQGWFSRVGVSAGDRLSAESLAAVSAALGERRD